MFFVSVRVVPRESEGEKGSEKTERNPISPGDINKIALRFENLKKKKKIEFRCGIVALRGANRTKH